MLEALLSALHLLAILGWTVFLTSQTALARAEWLNTAALARLVLLARIANIAAITVLATGALRIAIGLKGWQWPLQQPLLWAKLALFAWMAHTAWQAGRQMGRWHSAHQAGAALPTEPDITALRRRLLRATHLMVWPLLLGALLTRGLLAR